MNKQELITTYLQFCVEYGLDTQEVVVGHGGAMVMHGIRETTSDIDISIHEKLFDLFRLDPTWVAKDIGRGDICLDKGVLSLHRGHYPHGLDLATEEIDCVLVHDLQSIIESKSFLGRAKDVEAIRDLQRRYPKWKTPCHYCGETLPYGFWEYGPNHGYVHCRHCKGV